MKSTLILDGPVLAKTFSRLCRHYRSLRFAVAWCGSPELGFPYSYLETLKGRIHGVVGTTFNHSHPDGIKSLADICTDLRIVTEADSVFHPKIYFFQNATSFAMLVGSANFTFSGFTDNDEAVLLITGSKSSSSQLLSNFRKAFENWSSDDYSIAFDDDWLRAYRKRYVANYEAISKKRSLSYPPKEENQNVTQLTFLSGASWSDYYKKVTESLRLNVREDGLDGWTYALKAYRRTVPRRFKRSLLEDMDVRRVLYGGPKLGWFGNVGASGHFRHLLALGTVRQKRVIVRSINALSRLTYPVDEPNLRSILFDLVALGPTMKVWGRVLLLARPDLFFSVSYDNLRRNLARELGMTAREFSSIDGYIAAVKIVHETPWYNSPAPRGDRDQLFVWKSRAAYIDAVLRDE